MRLYYGWCIVAAALVTLTLTMGATFHSFGVFVRPISEELGLSRADANMSVILFSLGGAVWAPILGKMLDRLPIQRVMLACAVLMGASLATLGLSRSLLLSAVVLAVPLAIAVQCNVISANLLVARWFTVHRGRAMAIALFGMSLAGIVVTPAIALGVERTDWRQTLVVAGVVLGLALFALALFMRDRPGPNDVETATPPESQATQAAPGADAKPLTAVALLTMPAFWAIGLATAATLGFTSAVMVTLVPLAEGTGVGPTQAATLIAVLSGAGLVGGFVAAWIGDRVDRVLLLACLYMLVGGVAALFLVSQSFNLLVLGATLLGLSTGVASPVYHALIADRFGPASFGTAYGLMSLLMTVGGAIATRFAGEVFDSTGAYDGLFVTIIIAEVIAAALMFGVLALKPANAQAPGKA